MTDLVPIFAAKPEGTATVALDDDFDFDDEATLRVIRMVPAPPDDSDW